MFFLYGAGAIWAESHGMRMLRADISFPPIAHFIIFLLISYLTPNVFLGEHVVYYYSKGGG